MRSSLATFAIADTTKDRAQTVDADYAESLTALVADGWADRLPYGATSGRPTGERAAAIETVKEAFATAGVSGAKALRQRVLRLTYAVAILAANPRREDESEEAYVKRCIRIRVLANAGDMDAIEKAVTGKGVTAPTRRGTKGPKAGRTQGKGGKSATAPKVEDAPKEVTPKERYETAHNALVKALQDYLGAVEDYRKEGGKITKAAAQQVTHRANAAIAALAS